MRIRIALAAAAALVAVSAFADEEVSHEFTASVPRSGIRRVVIDIPAGEVKVRNGAHDSIRVSGEVRRSYDGWRRRGKEPRGESEGYEYSW